MKHQKQLYLGLDPISATKDLQDLHDKLISACYLSSLDNPGGLLGSQAQNC